MSQVIDFCNGGWGHAIHAWTFRPKTAEKWFDRIKDKIFKRRRYTVLVHSMKFPQMGDTIVYMGDAGRKSAAVVCVRPCLDPSDMFDLEILVTAPLQSADKGKP